MGTSLDNIDQSDDESYPNNDPNQIYSSVTQKLHINSAEPENVAKHLRVYNKQPEESTKRWGKKRTAGESPLSPYAVPPSAPPLTEEQIEESKEIHQTDFNIWKQRYLLASVQIETLHRIIEERQNELNAAKVEIDNLRSAQESDERIMQRAGIIANPSRSQRSYSLASSVRPRPIPTAPGSNPTSSPN